MISLDIFYEQYRIWRKIWRSASRIYVLIGWELYRCGSYSVGRFTLILLKMEDEITLINAVLQNDQYIAEAKLNEGSYGEIFKVKQNSTKQTYALKAMEI